MSVTIDANILVYASNESDPLSPPARALVERLAAGPQIVYLFWPTLLGYIRIVTHPGILPSPMTPPEATAIVAAILRRRHIRTAGEADGFWDLYVATAGDHVRGNDVPDAHVAALMHQHGVGEIYTRDRGFRRFDGIRVTDPFS